jgi:hypothetical protein
VDSDQDCCDGPQAGGRKHSLLLESGNVDAGVWCLAVARGDSSCRRSCTAACMCLSLGYCCCCVFGCGHKGEVARVRAATGWKCQKIGVKRAL